MVEVVGVRLVDHQSGSPLRLLICLRYSVSLPLICRDGRAQIPHEFLSLKPRPHARRSRGRSRCPRWFDRGRPSHVGEYDLGLELAARTRRLVECTDVVMTCSTSVNRPNRVCALWDRGGMPERPGLTPGRPRLGTVFFDAREAGRPAMAFDNGEDIELTVNFDQETQSAPLTADRSVVWRRSRDQFLDYSMPTQAWFHDPHGVVCLVEPQAIAQFQHFSRWTTAIRVRRRGGDLGLQYERINAMQSRIEGLDEWIPISAIDPEYVHGILNLVEQLRVDASDAAEDFTKAHAQNFSADSITASLVSIELTSETTRGSTRPPSARVRVPASRRSAMSARSTSRRLWQTLDP